MRNKKLRIECQLLKTAKEFTYRNKINQTNNVCFSDERQEHTEKHKDKIIPDNNKTVQVCGCETWVLSNRDEKKLSTFEIKTEKSMNQ